MHVLDKRRAIREVDGVLGAYCVDKVGLDAGGEHALHDLGEDEFAGVRLSEHFADGFEVDGLGYHVAPYSMGSCCRP
jgi:hypothetical protein